MKKLTSKYKAELKMESAIWTHGRNKATFTVAIKKLQSRIKELESERIFRIDEANILRQELIETREAWKKDRNKLIVDKLSAEMELSEFKALVKKMRVKQIYISNSKPLAELEQQVDKQLGL